MMQTKTAVQEDFSWLEEKAQSALPSHQPGTVAAPGVDLGIAVAQGEDIWVPPLLGMAWSPGDFASLPCGSPNGGAYFITSITVDGRPVCLYTHATRMIASYAPGGKNGMRVIPAERLTAKQMRVVFGGAVPETLRLESSSHG